MLIHMRGKSYVNTHEGANPMLIHMAVQTENQY
jgi:hypothetical protein